MKKIYYASVFTLLFFSSPAFSQGFEWIRSNRVAYSMNPSLSTYSLCTSPSGKIYASRLDSSTLYFGSIFGVEKIECYDNSGQVHWSYELGSKAIVQCIQAGADGNLYAAGSFIDTLSLGGTDSLANTGTAFTVNVFLISLDSTGSLRWKRNLSLINPNFERVAAIHFDNQGRCWYGFSDFNSTSIVRIDSLGQDVQTHLIQGTRTLGGFDFDPQGNLFVSGSTEGGFTLVAGGLSVPVNDSYMMFVLRIDTSGIGSWVSLAHDVTFQIPEVVCDPWGGAYVSGGLMDSTTFGTVQFDGPQWVYDIFLTHVDSLGNYSWGVEVPTQATITGDFTRGDNQFMDVDGWGNIYLAGVTRFNVDWGNGVVTNAAPNYNNISVLSFNANGLPRWALQGGADSFNEAYALAISPQGDCYFAAAVRDTIVFDTITINQQGLAFVLGKISMSLPASVPYIKYDGQLTVFPNPVKGRITVESEMECSLVRLYDVTGKLLIEESPNDSKFELDLNKFNSGMYFISVFEKGKQIHRKIIKE